MNNNKKYRAFVLPSDDSQKFLTVPILKCNQAVKFQTCKIKKK